MPTVQQLPAATIVNPTDQLPIEQGGQTMSVSVATLTGAVAPLVSPVFTGTPKAPTPPLGDSSNAIATTEFVQDMAVTNSVTLTGDISGIGTTVIPTVLPAITAPGTYAKVIVNAKGQVTGGTGLVSGDIAGLDVSSDTVLATGSTVARNLATRMAERIDALDFGAVGDGTTRCGAAITAAIVAAGARAHGCEVYLPAGAYRIDLSASAVFAQSGVVLRGAGRGRTILLIDDSNGTSADRGGGGGLNNASADGSSPTLSDFHLRDITFQGTRGQNGQNIANGSFLVSLHNVNNISVQDCEFLDAKGMSLGIFAGTDVLVRGNRVMRSNADSIAVWDVSDAVVTDNEVIMSGDDSISMHTSDATAAPTRSGIVIANNSITDGPGIHVVGAKTVIISGNSVRRTRGNGIAIGFAPFFLQGDTPNFSVQIVNNIVEDIIDNSGFTPGSTTARYITIGGSSKQAGTGASAPGTPVFATGAITDLYGNGTGNFYANGQSNSDGTHSVVGNTPSGGGYWVRVENNILVRTLPAVSSWSQWNYGSALQVGLSGVYNGAITEAMLNHPAIHIAGALRNSRIAGNIIQTTGANAIEFDTVAADMDYDGLEIVGNRIADFNTNGISWPTTTLSSQRIRVSGNDFDGDPYFKSIGRGPNGSWTSAAHVTALNFNFLSGAEIEGNHFRNVAVPVLQSASAINIARRNVIHGNPATVGFATGNQGVGTVPAAGNDYTHVIEVSDPTDTRYGKIASATLYSSPTQPSSGIYVIGHFVGTTTPALVNGQVFLGWKRLTTGSAHVTGTDWALVYGASGATVPATISNTYTASGAVAPTDNLALVNAAAAISMTLAAGVLDGHMLIAKRYGAGSVTLTATIDGAAGTAVVMNSASIKEALSLTWSQSLNTWLMI